ncbi:hypothetical protein [Aureimonas sp. AU20]|uniref:hypothetical protein n=1 Tax=Aureimonas sp. AU20 TaxID=1349819 RepID=UPI00071FA809|nr:hypothetical protein [Aureimonas sp. AU20]ALN74599.1 hypothetical protein M673_17925 [Aureimonas sp. AU20]
MFHIYVPFEDKELKHGAEHFGGVGTVFLSHQKPDLGTIAQDDILYILAHGSYKSGSVIAGTVKGLFGQKTARKTAAELASELVKHKLSKSFKDLRLLVCWGGYVGASTAWNDGKATHNLNRKASDAPFAGQLCSALKAKGFNRLTVTGYTGSVGFVGEGRSIVIPDVNVRQSGTGKGWVGDGLLGQTNSLNAPAPVETRPRSDRRALSEQAGATRTMDNANRKVWY